jgi:hypothetical protein
MRDRPLSVKRLWDLNGRETQAIPAGTGLKIYGQTAGRNNGPGR